MSSLQYFKLKGYLRRLTVKSVYLCFNAWFNRSNLQFSLPIVLMSQDFSKFAFYNFHGFHFFVLLHLKQLLVKDVSSPIAVYPKAPNFLWPGLKAKFLFLLTVVQYFRQWFYLRHWRLIVLYSSYVCFIHHCTAPIMLIVNYYMSTL